MSTKSKTSTFEVPKFSQSFSPLPFPLGSACGLWGPRAAAPEAGHRCTTQPRRATFPPSSGSSRPRQRWMRRTTPAVASDEGFGGAKPLEAMGSLHEEVDEMLIRFKVLVDLIFVFTFYGKSQSKHLHHHFVLFFVVTIFQDCVLCPP